MRGPYSKDLRERVVKALAGGQSCRAVAKTFGVSVASAVRWGQRYRATGETGPRRAGGRKALLLAGHRDWLLARIEAKPDLTLRGLLSELEARGVRASYYTVWCFFEREGYTFKKKPARQRARAPGRGAPARAVAPVPRPDRSAKARVHR
jgi:transposase